MTQNQTKSFSSSHGWQESHGKGEAVQTKVLLSVTLHINIHKIITHAVKMQICHFEFLTGTITVDYIYSKLIYLQQHNNSVLMEGPQSHFHLCGFVNLNYLLLHSMQSSGRWGLKMNRFKQINSSL